MKGGKTMREIKFRAWDKKNKYMSGEKNWYFGIENDGSIEIYNCFSNKNPTKKENIIIMQFTGLLDKNGKEIYEGDVIKHADPEMEDDGGQVVWEDAIAGFTYGGECSSFPEKSWRYEVIGNIYSNPELINTKS